MNNISALLALFTKGEQVANPQAWQKAQVAGTAIGGVILAVINGAQAFGYTLPVAIDTATANEIGVAGVTLFNIALSAVTHSHIGVGGTTDASK